MITLKNMSIALAITLIAGVGATVMQMGPGSAPGGSPSGPGVEPEPVTHRIERAGVVLEVTLDRSAYAPGERVMAHAVVTNESGQTVPWIGGGCNIPVSGIVTVPALMEQGDLKGLAGEVKQGLHDYVWTQYGNGYFLFGDPELEGMIACTADIRINQLEPGGKLETTLWWNQQLNFTPNALMAPAGTHTVQFAFPMQAGEQFVADPVAIEVPLSLQGDRPTFIGPGAAIDAALANEAVVAWYEAHRGEAVVKQEDGQWFVYDGFDDRWVPADESHAMYEQERGPELQLSFADGNWSVRFIRKMGPAPHEVTAVIDGATGEFLRMEEDARS